MKFRFAKTIKNHFGWIIASGMLLTSFQNCGKAGFDSSLDDSLNLGSVDAALSAKYGSQTGALVAAIPLAFDAGFDQIAYNSCADASQANDKQTFFTIKAGAYRNMGIKLNSAFYNYVDDPQHFKPIYDETKVVQTISPGQYQGFLADSPANRGAVANVAFRDSRDLLKISMIADHNATAATLDNGDVVSIAGTLTDVEMMDGYTDPYTNPNFANYFPFSTASKIMEAVLTTDKSDGTDAKGNRVTAEGVAIGLRSALMGNNSNNYPYLTLTYLSDVSDPYLIRSPASVTPLSKAYGRGYKFNFVQPTNANAVVPSNVLDTTNGITEIDLSTGGVISNRPWNCSMRYRVVRAQDTGQCPKMTLSDATLYFSELEIVRRQLPADKWDVNPKYRCAVPKGITSCYSEANVGNITPGVEYNLGLECYNPELLAGNYTGGVIPLKQCLKHITICLAP
jgi:hypothetical protein